MVVTVIRKQSGGFSKYDKKKILELIDQEQDEYLNRMKNNSGEGLLQRIAFNTSLKENVFAMLVCAMTRLPLIICGKPGCSKTLSFNLLLSTLEGPNSSDTFYRSLPTVQPFSYQGSHSSTSEGILNVFSKAKDLLEQTQKGRDKIISLVFFDELGLAEQSPKKSLKSFTFTIRI